MENIVSTVIFVISVIILIQKNGQNIKPGDCFLNLKSVILTRDMADFDFMGKR
ncbi:MAG: hypothetical protein JNM51_02720 [Bacteroidia bacterium]|nr:hypothetical protein [Bacteroidia bacterium]